MTRRMGRRCIITYNTHKSQGKYNMYQYDSCAQLNSSRCHVSSPWMFRNRYNHGTWTCGLRSQKRQLRGRWALMQDPMGGRGGARLPRRYIRRLRLSAPPPVRDEHLDRGTACLKCGLEPTAWIRWG